MILGAGRLPGQATRPVDPKDAGPAADFYDSQAHGNDFDGARTLAATGFTDVHGGVASFEGGNLVLTPDNVNGGTDAFARDFVLREGDREQGRDQGCRVVLPANYRRGGATMGLLLRFHADGTGLLLNFAPDAHPSLIAYSVAAGAATWHGEAPLVRPYDHLGPDGVEKNAAYFQADDGTHLTDAGYALTAAAVAGVIQPDGAHL